MCGSHWQALNTTTTKDKLVYLSYIFCKLFLTVSLLFKCRFSRPEEGDFPENLHRVVYVIKSKRSFESFMCLDLVCTPYSLIVHAPWL